MICRPNKAETYIFVCGRLDDIIDAVKIFGNFGYQEIK